MQHPLEFEPSMFTPNLDIESAVPYVHYVTVERLKGEAGHAGCIV